MILKSPRFRRVDEKKKKKNECRSPYLHRVCDYAEYIFSADNTSPQTGNNICNHKLTFTIH